MKDQLILNNFKKNMPMHIARINQLKMNLLSEMKELKPLKLKLKVGKIY